MIVGFSKQHIQKPLYFHYDPDALAEVKHPTQVNFYLEDAENCFIWSRNKPICDVPKMGIGNKPIDGSNYLFKPEEKEQFIAEEPHSLKYFHKWLGSTEFINNKPRFVLWLGDASPAEINSMPKCKERVLNVREYRLASTSAPTRKLADQPTRFHVENMPSGSSIIVPKTSSGRRTYIPMGFVGPTTFCGDTLRMIPNATIYHYGILQSKLHNSWMRAVTGRLKADYSYSAEIVYNNFIWPNPSAEQKQAIEGAAQAVLDAREKYPDSTLADMYDPDNDFLFPELTAAHAALDRAVEAAYGVNFNGNEEKIGAHPE